MVVLKKIKETLSKVIVAQDELIDSLIATLLVDGHLLVEGLPGVAKTTAIKYLADMLDFKFNRIQFTPDLLPSDIIGGEIYSINENKFKLKKGPIFSDFILADEINRAPAKVQSALLEAMQERQVTIGDKSYNLGEPFLVMATLNPIEQEGVYPLPEAQLDRFLMKVIVDYPKSINDEMLILDVYDNKEQLPKADTQMFRIAKDKTKKIKVDNKIKEYIARLILATRDDENIQIGASPRASIALYKLSQASAMMEERDYVMPSDVIRFIKNVLRHRIVLDFHTQSQGISADEVIDKIVKKIKKP